MDTSGEDRPVEGSFGLGVLVTVLFGVLGVAATCGGLLAVAANFVLRDPCERDPYSQACSDARDPPQLGYSR